MIRVQKTAEPIILSVNKQQWTNDLMQRIKVVGGYDHLTKSDKLTYVDHYKHSDIHAALKNGHSVEKCIYCERNITTGDPNVEHFHPKSIYPRETFEWENLFSACVNCNRPKGNFDTCVEPFIHPINDDPEEFLSYEILQIKPRYKVSTNQALHDKGLNVIQKCQLDRSELFNGLADTSVMVSTKANELKDLIIEYNNYKRLSCKERKAREILAKLNGLNVLARADKENVGFARECMRRNSLVNEAVNIVNTHTGSLGLGAGFNWGWNYNLPREI